MVELGQQLRLALEARQALRVGGERGGQDFEGEGRIPGGRWAVSR